MKLLLDENLSHRLTALLQAQFPGTVHVSEAGLAGATDAAILQFAIKQEFVLVTKDDDFVGLVAAASFQPSVVLIRMGNISNQRIFDAISQNANQIEALIAAGTRVIEIA